MAQTPSEKREDRRTDVLKSVKRRRELMELGMPDDEAKKSLTNIIKDHLSENGCAIIATHIDLGLKNNVQIIDLLKYRSKPGELSSSNGAFL